MQAGIWRHYKGSYYLVLGLAVHSETSEPMVVYVSLDAALPGPRLRVRPLRGPDGWLTEVNNVARFEYIGDSIL